VGESVPDEYKKIFLIVKERATPRSNLSDGMREGHDIYGCRLTTPPGRSSSGRGSEKPSCTGPATPLARSFMGTGPTGQPGDPR